MKTFISISYLTIKRTQGIALVITLLVIVVLTVAVTAFMQSMSLERRTSQAYLNILKADEAVQAGLQRVGGIFSNYTANDYYTITKTEDVSNPAVPIPYYFIGTGYDAASGTGKVAAPTVYTPLFSYQAVIPSTTPAPPAPVAGASNNKPVIPAREDSAGSKPLLVSGMPAVNTSWETIQTGDPAFPKMRYCFWVEDLSGRLDANVAGNKADIVGGADSLQNGQNNDKHLRDGTFSPNQLSLYTLFDKVSKADPGATAAGTLYDYRSLLLTISSLKQALGTAYNTYKTEIDESVTDNLERDKETQVIPYGLGFNKGGDLKLNVNALISDTTTGDQKVTQIAKIINENLPHFDLRKGASYARFKDPSTPPAAGRQDYVKTIAANIIDYADTDNLATVGSDYRGVDSYPFISEWTHKYIYTPSTVAEGGMWKTQVTVTPYLELWNLSDKSITGKFKFKQNNTDSFANGLAAATFTDTSSIVNSTDINKEYIISSTNPLLPNEYRVIQLATLNYKFPAGTIKPVFTSGGPNVNPSAVYTSSYEYFWEGAIVDEPYGKQEAVNRTLTAGNNIWRSYLPGFRYYYPDPNFVYFWDAMGDPRSTFYINKSVAVNTYNNVSANQNRQTWGGRNSWNKRPSETYAEREVNPSKWLDADHGNSALGTSLPNTGDPSTAPTTPTLQQEAVSTISNAGKYLSMTEIGHIYDPAQWNAKGPTDTTSTIPNYSPTATDIPANAGNGPSSGAEGWGGGFTLRIGRAEFTRFTQPDVEPAWKLLDLLSTAPERDTTGLININTASKDVLRSLVAGLIFTQDPGIRTGSSPSGNPTSTPKSYPYSSTYPVTSPASQADSMADAIIAGRPYLSQSQLSNLKNSSGTPVFGDKSRWSSSDTDRPTEWDDAGAEEMFKSVYELSTVRSRNFRVFVTGQVLNRLGKPVATSSKAFQIAVIPTRDPATKKITKLQLKIKNEVSPL